MSQTLQEEENVNAEEFGVLKHKLQKHIPTSGFGDAPVLCSTRVCASIHNCTQISVCTGLNRPCHLPCPCTSLCCSVCVSFLVCRNNLPKGKVHNMNFGISTIPSFLTNSVKLCSIHRDPLRDTVWASGNCRKQLLFPQGGILRKCYKVIKETSIKNRPERHSNFSFPHSESAAVRPLSQTQLASPGWIYPFISFPSRGNHSFSCFSKIYSAEQQISPQPQTWHILYLKIPQLPGEVSICRYTGLL